jgi:hypothetical protein
VQNPQKLGTLDLMKRQLDKIIAARPEAVGPVDRDMARAMRDRLGEVLDRMDELYPGVQGRAGAYRGSAEAIDAFEAGKADFMNTDPRLLKATIDKLPDRLQDLYRRGAYDALRSKLVKMKDGANIGQWLEDNPDIRDRVRRLRRRRTMRPRLRSDLNVERAMGDRKNFILGGPNTAERLIEDKATQPKVTAIGNIVRQVPAVGKLVGGAIDNAVTRRSADQTSGIMGEVGKIMTRTGEGIPQTFDEIQRLKANDAMQQLFADRLRGGLAGIGAARSQR